MRRRASWAAIAASSVILALWATGCGDDDFAHERPPADLATEMSAMPDLQMPDLRGVDSGPSDGAPDGGG